MHATDNLSALLAPRTVAVIGASDNAARIGGRPLRYMREAGFTGEVYPVNPARDIVQGLRSYGSVADLPTVPDVAIIAVPADATVSAIESCAARGVKSAIIFSAGFAETGADGAALQDRIGRIAVDAGMRVLGPNCLGVFNPALGFYGTFSVVLDNAFIASGPVAIVSQSGAYGSHIAHLARQRGLGISQWITTGNECDIDVSEALAHVVAQADTRVVMAYAEGVRNRDRFIAALERARELGKAIVFMKTGRSGVGAEAAASHTAALAGSDAIFDAVMRQYGVHRARTTAEQLDVAYACAAGRYPAGNKIGIFTMSGGFGIQLADDAEEAGLEVSPMPDDAQAELKALLPYCSPRNPVDATAQAVIDLPVMTRSIAAMLAKGGYDIFTAILGTGPGSKSFAESLRRTLLDAVQGRNEQILALTMSAPEAAVRSYEQDGFLVYEDGSALAHALGALARFRESFARSTAHKVAPADRMALPDGPLSERAAKDLLARAGLTFPREILVAPGGDAGAAAAELGCPVVIKISSPDIAHKTEVGGVLVNVKSVDAARTAAADMLARVREAAPDARIEGVIVAPMVTGGIETIVGVTQDPSLGAVVMFGLGGIFVEVLKDVTFRAAPFDDDEARRMIREIRGYAILEGVRGAPPADIDALAHFLATLSRFAAAHADRISSIDLNPVLVMPRGRGVVPLDALIVLNPEAKP
jgi:acyl-CoA synthetase (NDP forming)